MEITQTSQEIKRLQRNIAMDQRKYRRAETIQSYDKFDLEDKIDYQKEKLESLLTLKAFLELKGV